MMAGSAMPPGMPWDASGWKNEAAAWVTESLGTAGLKVGGDLSQLHRSPWSAVYTIETNQGRLYFKAVTPGLAHEVGLHLALHESHPDAVPPLLAANPSRGWLLMEDAGEPLRQTIQTPGDVAQFAPVLVRMAQLQIAWSSRAMDLLELKTLDRRVETLPRAFERLIQDPGALSSGDPEGISDEEGRRLIQLVPNVDELCQRLAGWGPPATLHHDDFHDANIFVRGGDYVFADWGEAGLGHPFFTPMIALRSLAWRLDLAPKSNAMARLRDAYLEAWAGYAALGDLRRAFDLAQRLAPISRALTWHHVMSAVPADMRGEDAAACAGWLRIALARLETDGRTHSPS